MVGKSVGHYQILEKLGEGAMGQVYLTEDTRLHRKIAIKLLPSELATDSERLARLEREAQSAAALNHPNICTIHEVGDADGQMYISMEYVQGQTLDEILSNHAMSSETALQYGMQLASAMAHAHQNGVIHRDLKSTNMMITSEGQVKILDFGLAKQLPSSELHELTQSVQTLTAEGMAVGTLPYMAPEILRGEDLSTSVDIWALGIMLYEMVTGSRPFQGKTGFELSSAILTDPVPDLPGQISAPLRSVIQKCLAKDPRHRYQRADQVETALETLESSELTQLVTGKTEPTRISLPFRATFITITAILFITMLVIFRPWVLFAPNTLIPERIATDSFSEIHPALSPDGEHTAYCWNEGGGPYYLYVRDNNLRIVNRLSDRPARRPVWSADGKAIVFLSDIPEGTGIYKVPAPMKGFEERLGIITNAERGLSWSPGNQNHLAFSDSIRAEPGTVYAIVQLDYETGFPEQLTDPPTGYIDYLPKYSPDGQHLAFIRENTTIRSFSTSRRFLNVMSLKNMRSRQITFERGHIYDFTWTADGRSLIVVADFDDPGVSHLYRISRRGNRLRRLPIGEHARGVSIAQSGQMVISEGASDWDILKMNGPLGPDTSYSIPFQSTGYDELFPQFSPDGNTVAFHSNRTDEFYVYTVAFEDRAQPRQFTEEPAGWGQWSHDGSTLAYKEIVRSYQEDDRRNLYAKPVEGGYRQTLIDSIPGVNLIDWSADDACIYVNIASESTYADMFKLSVEGGELERIIEFAVNPQLSMDGTTLFYMSKAIDSRPFPPYVGIWSQPVEGGPSEHHITGIIGRPYSLVSWCLWNDQIVYLDHADRENPVFKIHNPATGEEGIFAYLPDEYATVYGVTVSPDGQWLLCGASKEDRGADLQLFQRIR
ncbi:protein kinase [Candidatus Zixiibacteriota bacterium]